MMNFIKRIHHTFFFFFFANRQHQLQQGVNSKQMQQVFYFLFFFFVYVVLFNMMEEKNFSQCQGVVFTQVSQRCALTTKARSLFSVLKLINLRLLIALLSFLLFIT